MSKLYVGLSGFSHKPWQGEGRFYPPDIKQRQFLNYYASRFPAVEMDGTWYRMPSEDGVGQWIEQTPDEFQFCFKLHRKITHFSRLKPDGFDSLDFMLSRLAPAVKAGRTGSFLIQLPPNMKRDDERLETFFKAMPRAVEGTPIRYSIEFRHDTWHEPEVEKIVRDAGVAWVAADTDEADAQRRDTAGHIYARLRKTEYDAKALMDWKAYFDKAVKAGKDCYVFCKHEDEGSPWDWADVLLGR